ncbi:cytochrome c oxidase subunit CcoN [Myroides odoratimimus]|nr:MULTISPECIES: cbb3-type cytochrome c oxidase subunit I [Myroides]APA93446.1 cytochrome oxidase subunit I [Myroides sp. ZB35]MCA4792651.1 cbb3-type cytochrome c oxidase subunit I [Myroides odoratimimus]MCA4819907.1 cbb3-type cytochrome c oxidase subunit I [Myroides odoratimimus]MDM1401387.1 cbb3-type cytochrome c oxidase subunit I [Myroides odoratimimus]MDM1457173.1 cbb3-type cytochrome c oxidase subunit I [Myroides odoratimimus]
MKILSFAPWSIFISFLLFIHPTAIWANNMEPLKFRVNNQDIFIVIVLILIVLLGAFFRSLYLKASYLDKLYNLNKELDSNLVKISITSLTKRQIRVLLKSTKLKYLIGFIFFISASNLFAQSNIKTTEPSLLTEPGIIIILILISIPILLGVVIMLIKISNIISVQKNKLEDQHTKQFKEYLEHLSEEESDSLKKREIALGFSLSNKELSGESLIQDQKGLISLSKTELAPVVANKKRNSVKVDIDPGLAKLILWFLGTASFWLIVGTTIGEYLGIKFIAPDIDHSSWLSFGRLRPVHTNAVFWGWASLGMIGLGYYIVPRVSNTNLVNIKWGWYSLVLINASVFIGSISLMAGVNNGGGEYREYIWPIMLLFALGLYFTLRCYLKTIANRTDKDIYISNWYIVAAVIFITIVAVVGYLPFWQDGLGETIVQGYYMHQAVGMWFMLFTLGIVYYFLPQQLNKPIYSYSLGILAFWSQILFYTLIGTHHFVFSAIPWWLQTVAIVASVGMVIPVVAGTTNFFLTFKGVWYKIKDSYTIPFFVIGIMFYFTGSLQGTAESFRFTNLLWHFTDFTVAHSHLTMYGIITFLLWGSIYALVPQITGKEAPQITIGAHFWLALIGLLFYSIPLMYGGTLRGLMWMEDSAFIESVKFMMPYWLWRAIGGSLMWLSHLFFVYNFYKMIQKDESGSLDRVDLTFEKLADDSVDNDKIFNN